jgi:hypothetical protein
MNRSFTSLACLTGLCSLSVDPVAAAISLNQLSACADLPQFRAALDNAPSCFPPREKLGRVFAERIASWPGVTLCFRAAPTSRLTPYVCASADISGRSRGLLCFREARSVDIADYRTRYRKTYEGQVNIYLDAASQCEAGNGDASRMAPSMFPWIVTHIAEHEFAFVLPIGDRSVGSSAFIHGYAHLDPSIYGDDRRYIEYMFTWKNTR